MPEDSAGSTEGFGAAETVLAFVAVAIVWSVLEVALRGGPGVAIVTAIGAGAALGLVHGIVWVAAARGPTRLRGRGPTIAHAVIAVLTGLWLTTALGAWAKLGTRNDALAWGAIGAGVALALALHAVLRASTQVERLRSNRAIATAALVGVALVATAIDRTVFVGLHAPAHACLRAASVVGLALVLPLWRTERLVPPRDTVAVAAALALAAIPFATLRGSADANLASLWATPITDQSIATLRGLTDFDGDGFSGLLGGGDCAPLDPEVHPGAVEVADNGIDDNCADGDGHAAGFDPAATPVPATASPRSVLLVTVETLRADHMGLYGYGRDTTPALRRLATGARVYDRAFTAGAWTSIAIPTLLRGVHARRLSWRPFAETNKGRLIPAGETATLDPDERGVQTFMLPDDTVPTLAWWLQRRGMATLAVVDDRFSELLDPAVGTASGFETFVDADVIRGRDPDDLVVDLALATLAEVPAGRRFFLWVHLFGPHSPNTVHDGVPSFGEGLTDGYDHEIRFVDEQIGRLVDGVLQRDPAVVWIVTADHGEVLHERDRMHGFDLSEPVIRVPLVVGGTALPPGREAATVSTVDLVPTVLAATDTPAPTYLDGIDLQRGSSAIGRVVLVDTWHRRFDGALLFDQVGATDGAIEMVLEITKNAWALAELGGGTRTAEQIAAQVDLRPLQAAVRAYVDAPPLRAAPR